jgi:hypothetical protein
LPARWTCARWGTRPVSVTTPLRACTWIPEAVTPDARESARRTSRTNSLSGLRRDEEVVTGWLCVDAPGAVLPLVCASAYVAQIAQVATAAIAPIILIALLVFTISPLSLFRICRSCRVVPSAVRQRNATPPRYY